MGIEIERRTFLGGVIALACATRLPAMRLDAAPVIWANGVFDDSAGLQAAMELRPFRVANDEVFALRRNGTIYLANGKLKLNRTLAFRNNASFDRCTLDFSDCDEVTCMDMSQMKGAHVYLRSCMIIGHQRRPERNAHSFYWTGESSLPPTDYNWIYAPMAAS